VVKLALLVLTFLSMAPGFGAASDSRGGNAPSDTPEYTPTGQMRRPEKYREWVWLSSGFGMSYQPRASAEHSDFDNVFVNPTAYRGFLETGKWPDKTVLVLEVRHSANRGSINQGGHFQSSLSAVEVHVKDNRRFGGGWAFFGFGGADNGTLLPKSASCYSCHEQHGTVDTTFVQFYPTLLEVAKQKKTFLGESGPAK
jgi:hypothetical protein